MFHSIEKQIASAFHAHIQIRYGIDLAVAIEQPRQSEFGEMAVPAAFQLAKQLRQAPKKIAAELAAEIGPIPGVAAMEVAGNGYINIRLDRGAYAAGLLRGESAEAAALGREDHRRAHQHQSQQGGAHRPPAQRDAGRHVRAHAARRRASASKCRTTSTTPACRWRTSWWASTTWKRRRLADVQALLADPAVRFDYYCWDLYARTSSYYKDHPEALPWRSATLHAIEAGEGEVAELAHLVADAIVKAHLATMLRLDVEYDVLPRESEILHLKFWASAFELLKERKAIYFETEGKNAGCWVMPRRFPKDEDSKVIVRSDGTVTYVGKDIAYQLWKFGLLGKDFYYQPFQTYADGRVLWVTTDEPAAGGTRSSGTARASTT